MSEQLVSLKNLPSNWFLIASLRREAFSSLALLGAHIKTYTLSKPLLWRQSCIKLQASCEPCKVLHSPPIWGKCNRVISFFIFVSNALICPNIHRHLHFTACQEEDPWAFLSHCFFMHLLTSSLCWSGWEKVWRCVVMECHPKWWWSPYLWAGVVRGLAAVTLAGAAFALWVGLWAALGFTGAAAARALAGESRGSGIGLRHHQAASPTHSPWGVGQGGKRRKQEHKHETPTYKNCAVLGSILCECLWACLCC